MGRAVSATTLPYLRCYTNVIKQNKGISMEPKNTLTAKDPYIDKKLANLERDPEGSKWRIAEYIEVFGDELARDGSLTPEQERQIDEFIDNY